MNILIVCTGNILRSAMAEALLRSELPEHIFVESAGYPGKRTGKKPLPATRKAMEDIGLDVSNHRARRLTPEMISRSDLILLMTRRHRENLSTEYSDASDRMHLIKDFDSGRRHPDVKDRFHLTPAGAQQLREELRACIPGIRQYLRSKGIF